MDKLRKMALIQRSLGIRHKLKVHESMKQPETHEELAISLMAKWELEDELRAIEELLAESRHKNVVHKRHIIEREKLQLQLPAGESSEAPAAKKKPKK